MKLKILNLSKTETGTITLPRQFVEPLRKDLIKRAFLSIQKSKIQPYGADPRAGKRSSSELSRRRKKYRGSYGAGISRVPRKILSRRGTRMMWVGAFAPGTVGGRRAHPPKADKIWDEGINRKERRKAILSSISATMNLDLVKFRNHQTPDNFPFIIEDKISSLKQTKELVQNLEAIGFADELLRSKKKDTIGVLIVTDKPSKELVRAAGNLPGVDITSVSELNVDLLAPGGVPGRMTLFTESAIKFFEESKIFTSDYKVQEEKITKTSEKKK